LSQDISGLERAPVSPSEVRIHSIGLNPLDLRRVDVAVDLTPCCEALMVEMVIVGPHGEELCSVVLVDTRQWALDRIMHLRQDAEPGVHTLHVGVFHDNALVARAERDFSFAQGERVLVP